MKERIRHLRSRLAIPGYLLVFWGAIGNVSRGEYIVRKMDEFAQMRHARLGLITVGILWLAWLVTRKPSNADPGEVRVKRMRGLVREAQADFSCRKRETAKDWGQALAQSRHLLSIQHFLAQGFRHHVLWDYQEFLKHERRLWEQAGTEFDYTKATADWLGQLAERMAPSDLDPGFLLPHDYAQLDRSDTWTPNRRPL